MTTSKTIYWIIQDKPFFIGLDVHSKSWSVTLHSEEFELKTYLQTSQSSILVNYLRTSNPGAKYKVVYEAVFCGFTIQRDLASQGIECEVIHAVDVPTSVKEKTEK